VITVSAITLLLILGAIIAPNSIVFAKKHSNGGNNNGNDQKQKDDPNNSSNPPTDQPTNSGDQPPSTDGNPPTPPPPIQPLLPVNPPASEVDCSKTPDDPSCPPAKPVAPIDCIANPTDPSCPPPVAKAAVTSPPGPDESCLFHSEQEKCGPDQSGNCPSGFLLNGKGHCFPDKKCPKGFEKHDNDETGTCHAISPIHPIDCNTSYPTVKPCVPNGSPDLDCKDISQKNFPVVGPDPHGFDRDHDGIGCEDGQHNSGGNGNGNGGNRNNVDVIVHEHITSNNNPTSVVTRNTKITEQLTVGQAIDGCKDLTKKSSDNALKKSCNIMMAATFNYCMTHTKLWLTDSNICSDNLYLKNVQRYIAENVNLKLFPATIYNIRP
jgi:hypothetical protein